MSAAREVPVVVAAEPDPGLAGRVRIEAARRVGRLLLREAARRTGALELSFPRDPAGAPRPERGWHWSLANTTGLVCAAVAPFPIGVDAEWLRRPRWGAARDWLERSGELARLVTSGSPGRLEVLSLWSAKEAALKRAGVGLADLRRCTLVSAAGGRMLFRYGPEDVTSRLFRHGEHVVALAHGASQRLTSRIVTLEPALG